MIRRDVLFRKICLLLIPLLGIPLLFYGKEGLCIYTIWVSGAYVGSNLIPMTVASLLPIFFFPIFHILPASEVSQAYFRDVAVLFTVNLLMAMAVEEINLHTRIALGLLKISGAKRQYVLFNFMLATNFISFFLSDAATTALMIPIATAIAQTLQAVSRNDSSVEKGNEGRLESWEGFNKEDKRFGKALLIASAHCSTIGGAAIMTACPANLLLNDQMQIFYGSSSGITYAQWIAFSMPMQPFLFAADFVVIICTCMGYRKLFFINFGAKKDQRQLEEEEGSRRVVEVIKKRYKELGSLKFGEGTLLFWFSFLTLSWIFRKPGFMTGWGDFLPENGKFVSDSTIGILVASLMFIWPKDPWNDEKLTPILSWDIVKQKMAWPILFFIGQSSALAVGVKFSGLGDLASCTLSNFFDEINPFLLQVFAYLLALLARELFGVSAVLIGIFVSISQNYGLNPLYIGIPVTLILSFGFMMRTNVMNMLLIETKLISIWDTMYSGFFMDIVAFFLVILNLNTYGYWILGLGEIAQGPGRQLNCSRYY